MPHLSRTRKPFGRKCEIPFLRLGRIAGESGQAQLEAHAEKKLTLGQGRAGVCAGASQGVYQRLEIDMGGQVALARPIEDGHGLVTSYGLQRVAQGGDKVPVIDDQRSA